MTLTLVSRRSFGEGLTTTLGVLTNAAVAFLLTWMVGRGLGAEGTGYFFLLTSVFLISTSALGMGADTGLMRTVSRNRALGLDADQPPSVVVATVPILVVGGVVTAAVVVGAARVTETLGLGAEHVPTVRLLACFLLPATLTGVLLGGCRGLGRLHAYTAVQNLLVPLARAAGIAVVLLAAPSVAVVVGAWVAPLGVSAVLAWLLLRRHLSRPSARAARGALPRRGVEFWGFAVPRGLAVLVERCIEWADVLLVIALLGPAAGGVYGVVSRCAMAGLFLESAMRIVAGPRISAAIALEDHDRIRRIFDLVSRVLVLALWPFYLLLAVFADRVLGLFGEEFRTGATALTVVCLALMCSVAAGMLQTFLLMAGRSHWQLMNRTVQLAVLVVVAWFLVPHLGLVGAGLAWACGILADTTLAAVQVSRALGAHVRLGNAWLAMILPLVVVGLGSLAARALTAPGTLPAVAVSVAIIGVVYVLAVYALRHRLGLPLPQRSEHQR